MLRSAGSTTGLSADVLLVLVAVLGWVPLVRLLSGLLPTPPILVGRCLLLVTVVGVVCSSEINFLFLVDLLSGGGVPGLGVDDGQSLVSSFIRVLKPTCSKFFSLITLSRAGRLLASDRDSLLVRLGSRSDTAPVGGFRYVWNRRSQLINSLTCEDYNSKDSGVGAVCSGVPQNFAEVDNVLQTIGKGHFSR